MTLYLKKHQPRLARILENGGDVEKVAKEVERIIYEVALIFEKLEDAQVIHGNGHHMAQNLAGEAGQEIRERWLK